MKKIFLKLILQQIFFQSLVYLSNNLSNLKLLKISIN